MTGSIGSIVLPHLAHRPSTTAFNWQSYLHTSICIPIVGGCAVKSNTKSGKYLNISANGATPGDEAQVLKVEKMDGGSFSIVGKDGETASASPIPGYARVPNFWNDDA